MAKTYGLTPSDVLDPTITNPNVRHAINRVVFRIGYEHDLKEKMADREFDVEVMKALRG